MQFIMRKFGTKIKVKMTNLIAEYCNLRKENILFILQKLITIKKKFYLKKICIIYTECTNVQWFNLYIKTKS